MRYWNRRQFLATCAGTGLAAICPVVGADREAALLTRGIVLVPGDLTLADWPARVAAAQLTTIGIHHPTSPKAVAEWIRSDTGQRFLEACKAAHVAVEYELHAMRELLPRSLFAKDPQLFRMDAGGQRVADANCCVHSQSALEMIASNAASVARDLRPTTGRYFYWGDDGLPWCACPKCRELSPSEQSLLISNSILRALRRDAPNAKLAHLAYDNTMQAPRKVKPDEGVFLEFAPIHRKYDVAYARQQAPADADRIEALDANLEVFPKHDAQVLEYWLDVSRFSGWKRPAVKLPWNREVFQSDVAAYRARGIRHITSFAVWIDADYRERFGELEFLREYGAGLVGA